MCSGVWGDMYDGHWVGTEGIRIVTFGRKESIESGFLGVGIMGSHHCILATSLMSRLEGFPSATFFSDMLQMEAFLSATIGASSTISQHLEEAFKAKSEAQSPPIPEYLTEFTSVFSKKSFDILPEPKQWDHAVEIIPRSKASNFKVYPLSLPEQKELDAFLKENLET